MDYKKILKSASKLMKQIREELEEEQAAHEIIQEQGLVLTYDGDFDYFPLDPQNFPEPSKKQYPISLPIDNWTIPTQEFAQLILDEVARGMYMFIEELVKDEKAVLFIRDVSIKTKPKLKAIAKANGFNTINNFLDYFAEKEFENIPEKFKEDLFL